MRAEALKWPRAARACPRPRRSSLLLLILTLLAFVLTAQRATASPADGAWAPIGPPSLGLPVYDSVGDRLLLTAQKGDVYQLPLGSAAGWSIVSASGTPPSVPLESSAAFDPIRNRLLVFSGSTVPRLWSLSLGGVPTWSELTPGGPAPAVRYNASCVYDSPRDRLLIYGGQYTRPGPMPGVRSDVWEVHLSGTPTWNALATSGPTPPGRGLHGAIYDPVRDRMVVYAGTSDGSYQSNDAWSLDLPSATWSQIAPGGLMPAGRNSPVTFYDPVGDQMVMTNGISLSGLGSATDVWALSLSGAPAWTQLPGSAPVPTSRGLYDPIRQRMILKDASTWSFDLASSASSQLTSDAWPPYLRFPKASYDAARNRVVVVGQASQTQSGRQTWELSLGSSPAWTRLAYDGGWTGHAQVFDPVGDRVLVFGGDAGSAQYSNEVWSLDTGDPNYAQINAANTPPLPRIGASAIYDPVRNRMIVFGGYNPNTFSHYFNDVWALSLSGSPAWTQLSTAGPSPSGRRDHVAVYDALRDRMLVFGGLASSGYDNGVSALDLSGSPTWQSLAPSGTLPHVRANASGIYDPSTDALVIFGGAISQSLDENDVWKLSLSGGTPAWTELVPSGAAPGNAPESAAIFDPSAGRMVIYSAFIGGTGTSAVNWGVHAPASVSPVASIGFEISNLVSGSSRHGAPVVRFRLPVAASAKLRVFDVQGRSVGSRDLVGLAAGAHQLPVPELVSLASGVYVLRLEQGDRSVSARAVILR